MRSGARLSKLSFSGDNYEFATHTYETKTKLSEILNRVESGESFTITRKGKPVAILAPVYLHEMEPDAVVERLRQKRAGTQLGRKVSISGLRPSGTK